jgi:hypothetical protein
MATAVITVGTKSTVAAHRRVTNFSGIAGLLLGEAAHG